MKSTANQVQLDAAQEQLFSRFDKAWQTLIHASGIGMIFDADADGMAAARIASYALERQRAGIIQSRNTSTERDFLSDAFIDECATKGVDTFLALDYDPVSYGDYRRIHEHPYYKDRDWNLVIIDHHPITEQVDRNVVRVNPHGVKHPYGTRYCTAKLCYDLFGEKLDVSQMAWIAAAGVIGDHAMEAWHEFLMQTAQKYGINEYSTRQVHAPSHYDMDELTRWFRSPFARIITIINCARAYNSEKVREVSTLLGTLTSWKDARDLQNPYRIVQESVEHYCRNFKELSRIDEEYKVVWLEITDEFAISSWVSSIISNQMPEYVFLVYQQRKDIVAISARCQAQVVDCGKLMRAACKPIDGAAGGGHVPAAGAKVPVNQFDRFTKDIYSMLPAFQKSNKRHK
ncbi:MAG: DHH family phosphoesterase [Nanoarchaeota archaeon]